MHRPATSKMKIELPSLIIAAPAVVVQIAADVGGDVADQHVVDAQMHLRRLAVVAPAVQHVLDAGVGRQRVVRRMGAVHGDDVRQPPEPVARR